MLRVTKADVLRVSPSSLQMTPETSPLENLYEGQFSLSVQLIKPNYLVFSPDDTALQFHSFIKKFHSPRPSVSVLRFFLCPTLIT